MFHFLNILTIYIDEEDLIILDNNFEFLGVDNSHILGQTEYSFECRKE